MAKSIIDRIYNNNYQKYLSRETKTDLKVWSNQFNILEEKRKRKRTIM
jgi:hypothetical protein